MGSGWYFNLENFSFFLATQCGHLILKILFLDILPLNFERSTSLQKHLLRFCLFFHFLLLVLLFNHSYTQKLIGKNHAPFENWSHTLSRATYRLTVTVTFLPRGWLQTFTLPRYIRLLFALNKSLHQSLAQSDVNESFRFKFGLGSPVLSLRQWQLHPWVSFYGRFLNKVWERNCLPFFRKGV